MWCLAPGHGCWGTLKKLIGEIRAAVDLNPETQIPILALNFFSVNSRKFSDQAPHICLVTCLNYTQWKHLIPGRSQFVRSTSNFCDSKVSRSNIAQFPVISKLFGFSQSECYGTIWDNDYYIKWQIWSGVRIWHIIVLFSYQYNVIYSCCFAYTYLRFWGKGCHGISKIMVTLSATWT